MEAARIQTASVPNALQGGALEALAAPDRAVAAGATDVVPRGDIARGRWWVAACVRCPGLARCPVLYTSGGEDSTWLPSDVKTLTSSRLQRLRRALPSFPGRGDAMLPRRFRERVSSACGSRFAGARGEREFKMVWGSIRG